MPAKQVSQPVLIDFDFLETRNEISDTFLSEMVGVFNAEVPRLIFKIKKGYYSNRTAEVQNLGHKLKGMSQNMGAVFLGQVAFALEQGKPEEIRLMIEKLDGVFEKTRQILETIVQDEPPKPPS